MRLLTVLLAAALAVSADPVADKSIQPALAQHADGRFVCAFIREGNIMVALSDTAAKSWSPPSIAIDAKGMAWGGRQTGPRIAIDSKGKVYVSAPLCLDETQKAKKNPLTEIWFATSDDGGKTFGKPLQVNSPAGHAGEALHGMGVSAAGVAFVSWMDERDGGMGVWLARVEGGKAAANVCISALACPCCAPGVIADAKGRVRVIYREMSDDGSREVMVATSTDDGKTFGAGERVNRKDTRIPDCPVDAPAIAQSADGKQWMMAWMAASETDNDRNVYGLLGADGQKGKEERMNKDVKGKQGHPTVAYDAAGTAWAAWEDGRDGTTRVRVGNSTTAQPDDAVSPEGKTATFPSIAAGKRVGVAWEQDGAVEFRLVK